MLIWKASLLRKRAALDDIVRNLLESFGGSESVTATESSKAREVLAKMLEQRPVSTCVSSALVVQLITNDGMPASDYKEELRLGEKLAKILQSGRADQHSEFMVFLNDEMDVDRLTGISDEHEVRADGSYKKCRVKCFACPSSTIGRLEFGYRTL